VTSLVSRAGRLVALAVAVSAASSCALLPGSGPTRNELFAGSVQNEGDAFIVEVNSRVIAGHLVGAGPWIPLVADPRRLHRTPRSSAPAIVLALTIYENVSDGLLAGEGGNAATIESVQVDDAGFIFIPYAGRIRAAGNTTEQLRQIDDPQPRRTDADPQVIVRREAGDGSTVSVSGAVGGQGIYPIQRPTATLSGMLAAAGGVAVEPEIAQVTVLRGGHSGTIWYEDIFRAGPADIALRAGDRIFVEEDSRSFTALGATGQQSIVEFQTQSISALEAIASVGGLNPVLADPSGVFVLRNEPEQISRTRFWVATTSDRHAALRLRARPDRADRHVRGP
jgi:polysaccharide export outer membrane protein